jgi:hypothetical protein
MAVWLQAITPLVIALCATCAGLYQFAANQRAANRRPFLEQQLATCTEASEVAAKLACETDQNEFTLLKVKFLQLYFGRLAIVEDQDVEIRMVRFNDALSKEPINREHLQLLSLDLAISIRELVLRSWNVKLKPLQADPSAQMLSPAKLDRNQKSRSYLWY